MKIKQLLFLIPLFILSSCSTTKTPDIVSENIPSTDLVNITSEYFLTDAHYSGNKTVSNFSKAKSLLKRMNYFGIKEELYCGCEFSDGKIAANAKCGIQSRKNEMRAFRIEFEHIVPFENQVGHTDVWKNGALVCGDKKGRKCASKIFPHLEGDLWNLWPAGGELNADRSNYSYAMVQGPRSQYGKCNFIVEDRKVEPRNEVKALVAFTYMYFQKTYAKYLRTNYISNKNEKLFEAWAKMPLTEEQCVWAKEVERVQGNRNDFLLSACEKYRKN
jgi:deoxyribonuclease-1